MLFPFASLSLGKALEQPPGVGRHPQQMGCLLERPVVVQGQQNVRDAASEALNQGISGSKLVVIPESGHLSNLEAPEAFNGALAEFLGTL